MPYISRFAPSPTGPLHFGSLVAAVASYCDARANAGKWLLRMEDLDKPREVKGAANTILQQLESFGFEWDGDIIYQSHRSEIYEEYFSKLKQKGFIYACTCSRKELADSSILTGIDGAIYPKTCFNKSYDSATRNFNASGRRIDIRSWRVNVGDAEKITFKDAIQGDISQTLQIDVGDFIVKRKDGFFAYQLAVVVDDALQNITHIVRGADLLDSTPRQIYLQQLLNFFTHDFKKIHYAHVPVVTNLQGEKLSKQTLANPISILPEEQIILVHQLFDALSFLGQNPPIEMKKSATLGETWRWAISNWQIKNVPRVLKVAP